MQSSDIKNLDKIFAEELEDIVNKLPRMHDIYEDAVKTITTLRAIKKFLPETHYICATDCGLYFGIEEIAKPFYGVPPAEDFFIESDADIVATANDYGTTLSDHEVLDLFCNEIGFFISTNPYKYSDAIFTVACLMHEGFHDFKLQYNQKITQLSLYNKCNR